MINKRISRNPPPKWIYHIPYLEVLHVFEMPVLGYTGYVPFAWSVYQLTHIRPLSPYWDRLETADLTHSTGRL